MNTMQVNHDYLDASSEIPKLALFALRALFTSEPAHCSGNILIINTCLIGEFAVSMPALRDFIQKNQEKKVDLLVVPSQKTLAEKIQGVHKVYVAKAAHSRSVDAVGHGQQAETSFPVYEKTIALRVSPAAYHALRGVTLGKIQTSAPVMLHEGVRLVLRHIWRRAPMQYREMNFAFFGSTPRVMLPQDLFVFTDAERAKIETFDFLQPSEKGKRVLVHTNAHWPMKCWESERWVAALTKMHQSGNFRFIFVGTKDDEENQKYIASRLGFETYSLVGKITLGELLLTMAVCDYFLGLDSGPSNLSHVADLRSVTIAAFGPHLFLPWDRRDKMLDKSGGRGLLQMFFILKKKFISQITVDEVCAEFMKLVQENPTT
ncbi:MAG: glycosyltransferase family 9 protein [bacterium]